MDRLASPLLALFAGLGASAPEVLPAPAWRRHFESRRLEGSFVLFEPGRDRYRVMNEPRARSRFIPAATFEIAAAVAGLEQGAIGDEHEVFRWDGTARPVPAWERDHTFGSGLQAGAVWLFQEVARRIGKAGMREWLDRLGYGNRDLAGGIDLFWLQGGLRVSAFEQVDFLHRLAEGRLAATQRAQRLVREALRIERTRGYSLYAKAGSIESGRRAIAWWVGWVEKRGRPEAFFVLNVDPGGRGAAAERFAAVRAILAEAGVLPSGCPRA